MAKKSSSSSTSKMPPKSGKPEVKVPAGVQKVNVAQGVKRVPKK